MKLSVLMFYFRSAYQINTLMRLWLLCRSHLYHSDNIQYNASFRGSNNVLFQLTICDFFPIFLFQTKIICGYPSNIFESKLENVHPCKPNLSLYLVGFSKTKAASNTYFIGRLLHFWSPLQFPAGI